MSPAVRRLLDVLPVTRQHAGKHRARGDAAPARPVQRPATVLLDGPAKPERGNWT